MKKIFLSWIFLTLALALAAPAQQTRGGGSSTRLEDLAERLKDKTGELVNRTENNLRRDASNNRRDIENAFLARQFDSSAGLFRQMVSDEYRRADLLDAAAILRDLARRAPDSGRDRNLWNNAVNLVTDIERELDSGGIVDDKDNNLPASGRAFWRGRVDNRVQLVIREREIETRTIAGKTNPAGIYSFTSTIPNRDLFMEVDKKAGRGQVKILQQPNRQNNYTTVIEIYDDGGGADEYRLEIIWK